VIEERVAAAVRRPVRALRRIQTRGYAQAFHAIAELDDGSTAFVKAGAEDVTSEFLRQEIRFYSGAGGLAAVLAGFFASRAGLPPPPTAPGVRAFQFAQARVAIPWALRELGLRSDT
jgi:hypothetical protein